MKFLLKFFPKLLILVLLTSCSYHPNCSNFNSDGAGWMGKLPNDTALTSLVIPGTHDSMALYDFALAKTAAAQEMSFYNQMLNGVRFFDLRLSRDPDGSLQIYHGIKRMYITFSDIVEMARSFLDANPSEFLIFMIKEEVFNIWGKGKGATIVDEIEKIIGENEDYFYLRTSILEDDDPFAIGNKSISIDKLRGKILILRNYVDSEEYDLTHGCYIRGARWWWFSREGGSSSISHYDSGPAGIDEKWEELSDYIDDRSTKPDINVLYLHSVAAYYDLYKGLPDIDRVCRVINPKLLEKLTTERESLRKKPLGIFMCDKVYPELIKAMYDLNF